MLLTGGIGLSVGGAYGSYKSAFPVDNEAYDDKKSYYNYRFSMIGLIMAIPFLVLTMYSAFQTGTCKIVGLIACPLVVCVCVALSIQSLRDGIRLWDAEEDARVQERAEAQERE